MDIDETHATLNRIIRDWKQKPSWFALGMVLSLGCLTQGAKDALGLLIEKQVMPTASNGNYLWVNKQQMMALGIKNDDNMVFPGVLSMLLYIKLHSEFIRGVPD